MKTFTEHVNPEPGKNLDSDYMKTVPNLKPYCFNTSKERRERKLAKPVGRESDFGEVVN